MRAMMLFFAVTLAAFAFGAWVVVSNEAALLLAWPALMLAVMSIQVSMLGDPRTLAADALKRSRRLLGMR